LVTNGFLIENYPGLEAPLPGPAFAARLQQHLDRFELSVYRAEVNRVDADGSGWILRTDRESILAPCVILATGTTPREWELPEDSVARRRLFTEVGELLDVFPSPHRVLVIGGGEAAFDYALSLARAGAEVTILVRGATARAKGRLWELVNNTSQIRIEYGTRVTSLVESATGMTAWLETQRGAEQQSIDAVLTAIGRTRNTPNLPGSLAEQMDQKALRPAPGLFVCGDARCGSVGQAGIAVGDGLQAAAEAVAWTTRRQHRRTQLHARGDF